MGSRIAFGYDFDNYENFQNITTWKKELPLLSCDLPKEITFTVQKSLRISNLKLAVIIIIIFFFTLKTKWSFIKPSFTATTF